MTTTFHYEAVDVAKQGLSVALTVEQPGKQYQRPVFALVDSLGRTVAQSDSAHPLAAWLSTYALTLDKQVARGVMREDWSMSVSSPPRT